MQCLPSGNWQFNCRNKQKKENVPAKSQGSGTDIDMPYDLENSDLTKCW